MKIKVQVLNLTYVPPFPVGVLEFDSLAEAEVYVSEHNYECPDDPCIWPYRASIINQIIRSNIV